MTRSTPRRPIRDRTPGRAGAAAACALALLLAPSAWAADAASSPAPTASAAADRPPIEELFAGSLTYRRPAPGELEPPLSRSVESWGYAGPRPLARTDVVEPKRGDQFGLLLVANASVLKGAVGRLKFITRVPEPGIRAPGDDKAQRVFESEFTCIADTVCDAVWVFDHPWEIVPGLWEFEIRSRDGTQHLTHFFTVVAPASGSAI
jgi:hypothetical protein